MRTETSTRRKVLAASSGGGHWVELLRVVPAFKDCDLSYATVRKEYGARLAEALSSGDFYVVNDATRWNIFQLACLGVRMLFVVLAVRPDIVVSTGAAPGYFAIRFGKMLGARTIWIDSLANVERLSRAGQMARRYSDLWLTQWPDLATDEGPSYAGQVI